MGTLIGHVVPGIFFIIYGGWWSFISMWTHLKRPASKHGSGDGLFQSKKFLRHHRDGENGGVSGGSVGMPFSTSSSSSFMQYRLHKQDVDLQRKSWLPQPFCRRIPLEPIIKFLLPLVGMVVECTDYVNDSMTHRSSMTIYRVVLPDGTFNDLSQLQHITMYMAFSLSGLVDLAVLYTRFPNHVGQVFLALAFAVEGMLFYFHTGGLSPVSTLLHVCLTLAIMLCCVFALLRVWSPTHPLINVGLAASILLQGTWFIQVADILYGGRWTVSEMEKGHGHHDHAHVQESLLNAGNGSVMGTITSFTGGSDGDGMTNHNDIMFSAACFAWHIMAIALFALVEWVILVRIHSCLHHTRLYRTVTSDLEGVQEEDKLMESVTVTNDADL